MPCVIIRTPDRQAMRRLLFFRYFYSALALSILSPTIASAQQYRGWEYVGDTPNGESSYARLAGRSGDLIYIEIQISGITKSPVMTVADCATWKQYDPRNKQWEQVMPNSKGDSWLKKFC